MPYGSRLAAEMTRRLGRPCLYTPSARLALYLALRRWCAPGARVLMSPVNDDVILFVVLAAGLRPVQAPVSVWDGNIDPAAVPESTWRNVDAVLTTNLYGVPDRVVELRRHCDQLGIPLFEDAAHAIGTRVEGQPIGTFGTAAAFSLSKHVAGMAGGFLAVEDAQERREMERLRDDLLVPGRLHGDLATTLRPLARSAVRGLHLVRPVWRTMQHLGLLERDTFRMDLRPRRLAECARHAPSLSAYEPWVRVDLHGFRERHGTLVRGQLKVRMDRLDGDLTRRCAGVSLLAGTAWAGRALRDRTAKEGPLPLFRVPLLVEDRDVLLDRLVDHGVVCGYVYDPPLDDYAGAEFVEPSPDPSAARWFASHTLPADPLLARRIINALAKEGARPALPESSAPDSASGSGPSPGRGTAPAKPQVR
ncbi:MULTISPECIES: DegT/DnrJ/EryC1/StrS family aminotransferase [Streptomyces]|uniref:DegT/DnrJ/EryC1/StrS family aminotransferase n=1 Tax=Streptomyces TaxID=1883 RepID=UPI001E2D5EE4|nr:MULTISPECIES: DegT/DnrJ/EryC1/StrS family aminotransferase [Streptomyces]UFQ13786.1 DegT/DnrJ/EryC1/StrS family aminotransferase [Streptomyces huasconensis]WCL83381.1 DegT/DnrJ/EryC1/StrS family aminotransferase [Streptomyces sp. JCM 35825]